jgi:hypothetical protein
MSRCCDRIRAWRGRHSDRVKASWQLPVAVCAEVRRETAAIWRGQGEQEWPVAPVAPGAVSEERGCETALGCGERRGPVRI